MKKERTFSLSEADVIGTSATAPNVTGAQYVAALRELAAGKKRPVSLKLFERWLQIRHGLSKPFTVDEGVIEQFRDELRSGKFRNKDKRRYRSLARQAPPDVFRLHNRAATQSDVITRPLVDSHRYGRLKTIAALTPTTRKALLWFHESGTRTLKNGRQQLMTQATRNGSLAAALSVLQATQLDGLEHLTPDHVAELLPQPDPTDPEFRRMNRTLYSTGIVFRACVKAGLLDSNPLSDIDSSIFAAYAERDFIPQAEVDRVRDLSTVDMDAVAQVRDRLVVMLLIDTAMRKSELAAVRLADVRKMDDGTYQLRLDSGAQKMTGKPAAFIGILYPETQTLLSRYLTDIRPGFGGNRLIVDVHGNDAGPEAIYRAVLREGKRLDLRCYHSNRRPGCHDLRRTFATVNASPLGLRLTTAELAERMRASYDIVHEHYVVRNPLRASLNENEYRRRLNTDPALQSAKHLEGLAQLGIDEAMLAPIRQRIAEMNVPSETPQQEQGPRQWISEAEATQLLGTAWSAMPKARTFRDYMKARGGTHRTGDHGGLHMDAVVIQDLADTYVPLSDVVAMGTNGGSNVDAEFIALSIGRLHLVKRVDVAGILKALGNGHSGRAA